MQATRFAFWYGILGSSSGIVTCVSWSGWVLYVRWLSDVSEAEYRRAIWKAERRRILRVGVGFMWESREERLVEIVFASPLNLLEGV